VLLLSAYISVVLLIVLGTVPPLTGLVALTIPVAVRLIGQVRRAKTGSDLMDLPVRSAQLHLLFGAVYAAAFVLAPTGIQ
jgi:1,4-dihydroxy-2-naphthoate octaprenyltransferase